MNHSEAMDVTEMILRSWPGRVWTAEEMDAYATGLMWMAPEHAVNAVSAAQQRLVHRPAVAELREFYDIERAKHRAKAERPAERLPRRDRVPLWVRRWVAARYLHAMFGKEVDMRRFPEQQDKWSPEAEMMPDDAWLAEAEHVTDDRVWKTLQG